MMPSSVAEFLSADVLTISSRTPLAMALAMLVESESSELCVVDETGRLQGVVTDYELLKSSLQSGWETQTVASCISRAIVVVSADASIEQVVPLFRDGACSKAFVCRDGRVIGILTRKTVLRHVSRSMEFAASAAPSLNLVMSDGQTESIEPRREPPRAPQFLTAPQAIGTAMSVLGGVCTALR